MNNYLRKKNEDKNLDLKWEKIITSIVLFTVYY